MRYLLVLGLMLLTGFASAAPPFPVTPSDIRAPFSSVVYITVLRGSGTGIVVGHTRSEDTCITEVLTAKHMVDDGQAVFANKYYRGDVERLSPMRDMALVEFFDKECLGTPVRLAKRLKLPARILAAAFPQGAFLVSGGWASIIYDDIPRPGGPYLIHSAAFGPGSSGSPVFNKRGRLIGMTVGGVGVVALAVPLEQIREFLDG